MLDVSKGRRLFAARMRLLRLLPRFRATASRTYAPVWREMMAVLRRQWWTGALSVASAATALAWPASAVLSGSLDPGRLITYVLAAWGVMSISSMGMEAYDIEYGLRGIEAADALAAEHRADRHDGGVVPGTGAPEIRFEDVTFAYPGSSRPVLDGLTLTLRPGQTVAVVGENGVGKTTLVKLLAGLYTPDSGRITVDGVDVADLDRTAWRRRLTVSLMREAAGGRTPLCVVLDEPTAALDPLAEYDLFQHFVEQVRAAARAGAVTVLVSHRFTTVRMADLIVVVDDGRVTEAGSHAELMATGRGYAELYRLQEQAYR